MKRVLGDLGVLAVKIFCGLCLFQTPTPPAPDPIHFAIIGDYGLAGVGAESVAGMVKSWEPDFILTTGDNNYPVGAAETIDDNIGQYYHEFIFPYKGMYGEGADENRFFPTLGNHDWQTGDAQPYLDYFELPGNERYYDVVIGPVHFFALDNNYAEPDGFRADSLQAQWLQDHLEASHARWKLVYMHVPPLSSGHHGSNPPMDWPFAEWGADVVIAGHEHIYERLTVDDIPYFVNGIGGGGIYSLNDDTLPETEFRYNRSYGAMRVTATEQTLRFEFYAVDYPDPLDTFTLYAAINGN